MGHSFSYSASVKALLKHMPVMAYDYKMIKVRNNYPEQLLVSNCELTQSYIALSWRRYEIFKCNLGMNSTQMRKIFFTPMFLQKRVPMMKVSTYPYVPVLSRRTCYVQ